MNRDEALSWLETNFPKLRQIPYAYEGILDAIENGKSVEEMKQIKHVLPEIKEEETQIEEEIKKITI